MSSPDYSNSMQFTTEKPACFDSPVDGMQTLLKTPDSEQKIAEGGLRLQGLYKNSSDDKPLITVVTVVFNGADFLEETIKSIIEQTYDNVEYIIVDGGSTDDTLDIIKKYEGVIDYWVSEQDKGIYDAMNKGIDLASGVWINFMNAGDLFYESDALHKIFDSKYPLTDTHVIFGDHEVRYPNKRKKIKAGKVRDLCKGSQFCHQSVFFEILYHKQNKYDVSKLIAADFQVLYVGYLKGLNFTKIDGYVSTVTAGGVSDAKRIESLLEQWSIVGSSFKTDIFFMRRLTVEIIKKYIMRIFALDLSGG